MAARIARQKEIDASIAAKAEFEYLYDKPYDDKKKVRVAGPFTVESLSPHRVLGVDENDELIDPKRQASGIDDTQSFAQMILENLKTAGVQQAHKDDRIVFTSLVPWSGELVCAEGIYKGRQCRDGAGEAGGDLHWTGVRHRNATGSRGCGQGSRGCGVRCADCVRLQLRSPHRRSSPSSDACRCSRRA